MILIVFDPLWLACESSVDWTMQHSIFPGFVVYFPLNGMRIDWSCFPNVLVFFYNNIKTVVK